MLKLCLNAIALALVAAASPSHASSLEAFYGHWVGSGITENEGPGSNIAFADRDLDVTIAPIEQGFRITWQTVRRDPGRGVRDLKLWSVTVPFVEAGRGDMFRMAASGEPILGEPYMWAQIADRSLTVHSIAIAEDGTLEYQKYVRTLLSDTDMQLRFTRSVDGSIERSVLAVLSQKQE